MCVCARIYKVLHLPAVLLLCITLHLYTCIGHLVNKTAMTSDQCTVALFSLEWQSIKQIKRSKAIIQRKEWTNAYRVIAQTLIERKTACLYMYEWMSIIIVLRKKHSCWWKNKKIRNIITLLQIPLLHKMQIPTKKDLCIYTCTINIF